MALENRGWEERTAALRLGAGVETGQRRLLPAILPLVQRRPSALRHGRDNAVLFSLLGRSEISLVTFFRLYRECAGANSAVWAFYGQVGKQNT